MKKGIKAIMNDLFWNTAKKITNNFSTLEVINLGEGNIKCLWSISSLDDLKIKISRSYFYAIRLFDISNNRNKNDATCIMKEIQVSKYQSSVSFPIPINKGVYYFEFGFRKRNGEWRSLAYNNLNLGYRIKQLCQRNSSDRWFSSKSKTTNHLFGPHELTYQLSLDNKLGGSENLIND